MAFDWISATALVVGIGSLYLTYQSTKSAKKAIDTSIELYEKQKQDAFLADEDGKKNQIQSLCYLIQNEVSSNVILMREIVIFFDYVKNSQLVSFSFKDLESEPFVVYKTKDGDRKGFIFTRHSNKVINRYLFEVSKLDNNLISELVKLGFSIEHYNDRFLISLINFFKLTPSIDDLSKYINDSKGFLDEYNIRSKDILRYCSEKFIGI